MTFKLDPDYTARRVHRLRLPCKSHDRLTQLAVYGVVDVGQTYSFHAPPLVPLVYASLP